MSRRNLWKPPRNVTLRDLSFDDMALGVRVVRGTLWPSGEHFAATLWAISGRPSGERVLQVIYTDRGAYRTGLDHYELAAVCFTDAGRTAPFRFAG